MLKRILPILCSLPLLLGCEFSKFFGVTTDDGYVSVSLITDNHSSVTNKNPQKVLKGDDATFYLDFETGYIFYSASSGIFDSNNQCLTIRDVQYSCNVYVQSAQTGDYKLNVINDENKGSIDISPKKSGYNTGDVVSVTVTPKDGSDFLCYSWGDYCRTAFSEKAGNILSFDRTYVLTIEDNTTIAVNYFDEKSSFFVDYDLNGGVTSGGSTYIRTDCYDGARDVYNGYTLFNIASYIYRNGFCFTGLNTKPDGSGVTIGSGSRISLDLFNDKRIVLYAQWIKETEQSLFDINIAENGTANIVGFHGPSDIVDLVIPEKIGDKTVSSIKANSFVDLEKLKNIYLNKSLVSVEKNSFAGLKNLTTLHIFSSLKEIYDESFNSQSLSSVFINKNSLSIEWSAGSTNFTIVYERAKYMSESSDLPIVYFVGLSTMIANHDLTPFAEKYAGKYQFFLFGENAGLSFQLILLTLRDVLRPQDIVVCPFYHTGIVKTSTSPNNILNFQYDLDYLSSFDYQAIKHSFFSTFMLASSLMESSLESKVITADNAVTYSFEKFGGYFTDLYSDDPNNGANTTQSLYAFDYLNVDYCSYLIPLINSFCIDTSKFYISWNSYNENCIRSDSAYQSFLDFEQMIRENFNFCSFLDTMQENIYPGNYFQPNDAVHLSRYGGDQRVNRWLKELPL